MPSRLGIISAAALAVVFSASLSSPAATATHLREKPLKLMVAGPVEVIRDGCEANPESPLVVTCQASGSAELEDAYTVHTAADILMKVDESVAFMPTTEDASVAGSFGMKHKRWITEDPRSSAAVRVDYAWTSCIDEGSEHTGRVLRVFLETDNDRAQVFTKTYENPCIETSVVINIPNEIVDDQPYRVFVEHIPFGFVPRGSTNVRAHLRLDAHINVTALAQSTSS